MKRIYDEFLLENSHNITDYFFIELQSGELRCIYCVKAGCEITYKRFRELGGNWRNSPMPYTRKDYDIIKKAVGL